MNIFRTIITFIIFFCGTSTFSQSAKFAEVDGVEYVSGYLARLLINENPFPGEKGYKSLDDSKIGMVQILWVLHSRLKYIPAGYRQEHVANIKSEDIIDIITAQGQCDGFSRDEKGVAVVVPRVEKRLNYLLNIANKGDKPGKFSELINYGQGLARAYAEGGIDKADRFAGLEIIKNIMVTGRAYSWMTDKDYYRPGGDFVYIPDSLSGSIGGNRFYTLKKKGNSK
ncbi:MAG TPA: hypothetical protein DCZ94_11205 [Lentisphaeria bacterium]|nr:MAG: hypothetical protein A2X48_07085 [Lentisphaerae bacterium GWF2_49_21]HBC87513.1 hypothetical protein [Lentisphaeria bacterium]